MTAIVEGSWLFKVLKDLATGSTRGLTATELDTELNIKVSSALEARRFDLPPRFKEAWWLRPYLSRLVNPHPSAYAFLDRCVESAIPRPRPLVDSDPGWIPIECVRPDANWLATIQLRPPNGDVLSGLAIAAATATDDIEIEYKPPTLYVRDPTTDWIGPARAVVTVVDNTIVIGAHTMAELERVVPLLTRPAPGLEPGIQQAILEQIVDDALTALECQLANRRGWRQQHPGYCPVSESAIELLRHAPLHDENARTWAVADSSGAAAIEWIAGEVGRLDPMVNRDGPCDFHDLWEQDTVVLETVRQWVLSRSSVAAEMQETIDKERSALAERYRLAGLEPDQVD